MAWANIWRAHGGCGGETDGAILQGPFVPQGELKPEFLGLFECRAFPGSRIQLPSHFARRSRKESAATICSCRAEPNPRSMNYWRLTLTLGRGWTGLWRRIARNSRGRGCKNSLKIGRAHV